MQNGKRGTVLVVDDEERDRTKMANALRSCGYAVLEAGSYSDAMAMFDLHRDTVKLLVTDVSLSDGNGCALAIAIRKQVPGLRVLFVSFHVGAEVSRFYGLDLSGIHFLGKPFGPGELASRVGEVLKSRTASPRLSGPRTLQVSGA